MFRNLISRKKESDQGYRCRVTLTAIFSWKNHKITQRKIQTWVPFRQKCQDKTFFFFFLNLKITSLNKGNKYLSIELRREKNKQTNKWLLRYQFFYGKSVCNFPHLWVILCVVATWMLEFPQEIRMIGSGKWQYLNLSWMSNLNETKIDMQLFAAKETECWHREFFGDGQIVLQNIF